MCCPAEAQQPGKPKAPDNPARRPEPDKPEPIQEPPEPIPVLPESDEPTPMDVSDGNGDPRSIGMRSTWRAS